MDTKVLVSSVMAIISAIGAIWCYVMHQTYQNVAFSLSTVQFYDTFLVIFVVLVIVFVIAAIYFARKS